MIAEMPLSRLIGIHAVEEALRAGRPMQRVTVVRDSKNRRLQPLIDECRRLGVPLRFEPREALDRLAQGGAHRGIVAEAAAKAYAGLEDVLDALDHPGLLVVLDGVEDPHNLGAIIRSAHAAGADALLLPERRSAGLNETVSKTAAGASSTCRSYGSRTSIRPWKSSRQRAIGSMASTRAGTRTTTSRTTLGNVALVLGGEGKGLHELTAKRCDFLVKIPVAGRIASLNVSVAAGIVLFEALRRRRARK